MKLLKETYDILIKRGNLPSAIDNMSEEEIFEEYCEWHDINEVHGISDMADRLIRILDNARACRGTQTFTSEALIKRELTIIRLATQPASELVNHE